MIRVYGMHNQHCYCEFEPEWVTSIQSYNSHNKNASINFNKRVDYHWNENGKTSTNRAERSYFDCNLSKDEVLTMINNYKNAKEFDSKVESLLND